MSSKQISVIKGIVIKTAFSSDYIIVLCNYIYLFYCIANWKLKTVKTFCLDFSHLSRVISERGG